MGLLYDKNRLRGQLLRSGYEGEGTGGGWGDWGGGDSAPAGPMGPPTESQAQAAAQEFANSLSQYEATPADAVIVPLVPLAPQQIKTDPVANLELVRSTTVDVGALLNRGADFLLGLLGIASGTPAGVVGGSRAVAGAWAGPSPFGSTITEVVTFPGSSAPAVVSAGGTGAAAAAATFAGIAESGAGDQASNGAISGAPVLGFGGAFVNNPSPTGAGSTAGGLTSSSSAAAALRGRYAAPVGPAAAAPAISPAVIAAGLASLLFLG
jgi:hypothetical protein